MKHYIYYLFLVVFVLAMVTTIATAQYQRPPLPPTSVKVDSIAPCYDWRSETPSRGTHILADPKTGKMAFVAGYGNTSALTSGGQRASLGCQNTFWMYSSDKGKSWTTTYNALDFLGGAFGEAVIAADSNFHVYVAFREKDAAITAHTWSRLWLAIDTVGDGQHLGMNIAVNDPTAPGQGKVEQPQIVVSPDGQNIIITANQNLGNDCDSVYAYVSHDGGSTFTAVLALTSADPAIAPIAPTTPKLKWDSHSLCIGTGGYAFLTLQGQYDGTRTQGWWSIVCQTTDYGNTWTSEWVTPPPISVYDIGCEAYELRSAVVLNNVPHIAYRMKNMQYTEDDVREMVDFYKEGGSWHYSAISHYDPTSKSYDVAAEGCLGVDTKGRLICVWEDRNKSTVPAIESNGDLHNMFVAGSTDGGNTWTNKVRLTDREPFCIGPKGSTALNQYVNGPQVPPMMGDTVSVMFMNCYIWPYGTSPGSAWIQARFPVDVIWTGPYDSDPNARIPQTGGYVAESGTYNFTDISATGTSIGASFHNSDGSANPDDGAAGPYQVGFSFPFFGNSYSQFWVTANGAICFTDSTNGDMVLPPADNGKDHGVVAIFNYDIYTNGGTDITVRKTDVFVQTNTANDTCIIQWNNFRSWSDNDSTLTFEIILAKKDTTISYMYKDVGLVGAKATIGAMGGPYTGLKSVPTAPTNASAIIIKKVGTTGVALSTNSPLKYALNQAYPNPFNPSTNFTYEIAKAGFVSVKIYDLLGREVATLVNEVKPAGSYPIKWNAAGFSSGIYFYKMQSGSFAATKKLVLMK